MSDDEHLKETYSTLKYSLGQFDKTIIFIASGALGISFAFIKDLVPDLKVALDKDSLTDSWYLFSGVIFISLICHFISMLANTWAIKHSDLKAEEFNKRIVKWNFWIRGINIIMIFGLFFGALFLISFIKKNINV